MTYASPWIVYVTDEPRDDVQVQMWNRLASRLPGVEADVIAVWSELSVDFDFDVVDEGDQVVAFNFRCIPPRCNTPFADYETVTRADRKSVPDRKGIVILRNPADRRDLLERRKLV